VRLIGITDITFQYYSIFCDIIGAPVVDLKWRTSFIDKTIAIQKSPGSPTFLMIPMVYDTTDLTRADFYPTIKSTTLSDDSPLPGHITFVSNITNVGFEIIATS